MEEDRAVDGGGDLRLEGKGQGFELPHLHST
jgi:hypothetical protein